MCSVMRTARQGGFPAGGFLVVCFCFYPEASALVPRIADGRMAACQS